MRQHQSASNENELHVLLHSGLKAHFDSPGAPLRALLSGLGRVDFVGDEALTAPGTTLDLPVLIPVTSESHGEGLRAVRSRHPLALLVAVTNDISGYRTYYAIHSGANFVLNLAIPGDRQIDMLYAHFLAHQMTTSVDSSAKWLQTIPVSRDGRHDKCDDASGSVPEQGSTPGAERGADRCADHDLEARPGTERFTLSTHDRELVRLLCTSMTVSEIARRHYCSERSMYRRIRKLYDDLEVGGRSELVSLAATLDLVQPVRARAG